MKKRLLALLLTALMVFTVVGCGDKEEKTEAEKTGVNSQEEIVKLVNEDLPGIAAERDSAVKIYNDYFESGADIDSETWKSQLENDALTSYDAYLEKLAALTYTNSDVQNLKDLYEKSAKYQRDAIQYVVDAINAVDSTKLADAQQAIEDSKTYLGMYQDELKKLCESYGITIVGEFQTTTMTDATSSDADGE